MTELHSDRRIEYVPLDRVVGASRNPKGHDIGGIRASIGRFGVVAPSVIDERTGKLVAGHGRTEALRAIRDAGETPPAGVTVNAEGEWLVPLLVGWSSRSDAEAEAYLVADNNMTVRGGWDDSELATLLGDLADADPDLLAVTGFTDDDLAALLADEDAEPRTGEGGGAPGSDGSLLAMTDVSVAEPVHQVSTGDHWVLGDRHHLVVVDVMTGWPTWSPLLDHETALFVPYPGPYAPLSLKADDYRLVMVQPDHYIAGHILDKYVAVCGDDALRQVPA